MNRLRVLREDHGISQAQLAKDWNTSPSAISAWENETNQMDYAMLIKASHYYSISIDYILENESMKELSSEDERQLLSKYRSLNKKLKNLVVSLANEIYKLQHDGDYE